MKQCVMILMDDDDTDAAHWLAQQMAELARRGLMFNGYEGSIPAVEGTVVMRKDDGIGGWAIDRDPSQGVH